MTMTVGLARKYVGRALIGSFLTLALSVFTAALLGVSPTAEPWKVTGVNLGPEAAVAWSFFTTTMHDDADTRLIKDPTVVYLCCLFPVLQVLAVWPVLLKTELGGTGGENAVTALALLSAATGGLLVVGVREIFKSAAAPVGTAATTSPGHT